MAHSLFNFIINISKTSRIFVPMLKQRGCQIFSLTYLNTLTSWHTHTQHDTYTHISPLHLSVCFLKIINIYIYIYTHYYSWERSPIKLQVSIFIHPSSFFPRFSCLKSSHRLDSRLTDPQLFFETPSLSSKAEVLPSEVQENTQTGLGLRGVGSTPGWQIGSDQDPKTKLEDWWSFLQPPLQSFPFFWAPKCGDPKKLGCAISFAKLFQYSRVSSEVSCTIFCVVIHMLKSSLEFEILRNFISSEVKSLAEKAAPLLGLGAGAPKKVGGEW